MTPEQALRSLSRLTAAFRPRDWSAESAAVYAEALMDLKADWVEQACVNLVQRSSFMPTVADIRSETWRVRDRLIGNDTTGVPVSEPDDVAGYLRDLREGNFRPSTSTIRRLPPGAAETIRKVDDI